MALSDCEVVLGPTQDSPTCQDSLEWRAIRAGVRDSPLPTLDGLPARQDQ
jgi:hypothetical protein